MFRLTLHFRPQKYRKFPGILGTAASSGSCPRILECWNLYGLLPIFWRRNMRPREGTGLARGHTASWDELGFAGRRWEVYEQVIFR